ncbi:MAG TPA: aminotransferase class I/II-fold pyridoxal phosphate-dependent enzyme [Bryobacteraceae bacterium]|nr:aminotransferase class I/II-fold pyridoxal phosphate-dependent enzyme [Bryobacteraceae bacterium]
MTLSKAKQLDLLERGFSRRNFAKISSLLAAGSTLPFFGEPALAQLSKITNIPADAVMINANENPLGPCPEALAAAQKICMNGGRYLYSETDAVQALLAEQEGLKTEYVRMFPGSSAPLHQGPLAFCSPTKAFVCGDPGYESGAKAAQWIKAPVVKVPLLRPSFAHDVKAMAAVKNAGLIYICNPNNPTGTMTPRADIEWLLANKPAGSILMLDEAYTHIVPDAYFCSDLVAKGKDIIILRTFSKIYGLAGLRAGAVFARPDLMEKISGWTGSLVWSSPSIAGMAAAHASLQVKDLIPERKAKIGAVREDLFAFFDKHKVKYIPSVSNCVMVDTGKVGKDKNGKEDYTLNPVMLAMREAPYHVFVGRVWPSMPTYIRVTVGLPEEMERFKAAFLKTMSV